jgi:hypothetical protein
MKRHLRILPGPLDLDEVWQDVAAGCIRLIFVQPRHGDRRSIN